MATETVERTSPLIVIAGPTASGKTALAIRLAERFGGEIICADSRTVYTGMDVGTAKPTPEEQARVPHWGIDLVEPGERYTAAQFKVYAERVIQDICSRGRVPFLVGGTGLYVDAVVFDYQFTPESDMVLRQQLETMNKKALQKYCHNNNILLPKNEHNIRHLVRAIERNSICPIRRSVPIDDAIVVGITTNKNTLRTRIELRNEQLFANNVVEEAIILGKKYGWEGEAMKGNIYPIIKQFLDGDLDEAELRERACIRDWGLAKRQMTWLRRNEHLVWGDLSAAELFLSRTLAARRGL